MTQKEPAPSFLEDDSSPIRIATNMPYLKPLLTTIRAGSAHDATKAKKEEMDLAGS